MAGTSRLPNLSWSGLLGVVAMLVSLIAGYVTLQNTVAANATDIAGIDSSIDRLARIIHDGCVAGPGSMFSSPY